MMKSNQVTSPNWSSQTTTHYVEVINTVKYHSFHEEQSSKAK